MQDQLAEHTAANSHVFTESAGHGPGSTDDFRSHSIADVRGPGEVGKLSMATVLTYCFGPHPHAKLLLAQVSETSLRPGFQQAELRLCQVHFQTYSGLALFLQIEAGEDFAITAGKLTQDPLDHVLAFAEYRGLLWTAAPINDSALSFYRNFFRPRVNNPVDMGAHLPACHRSDETHEPFWLSDLTPSDRLDDEDEYIVQPVFQILGDSLAAEIKP